MGSKKETLMSGNETPKHDQSLLRQHLRKIVGKLRAALANKRQETSDASVDVPVQQNGKKGGSGPVGDV
jgi:hypothetical protein